MRDSQSQFRRSLLALGLLSVALFPTPSDGEPIATGGHNALYARWGGADLHLPPDPVIWKQMEAAYALRLRREFTRTLDAVDPGEMLEDATSDQPTIETRKLGPEALFAVGDDLFELMYRPEHGLGNGLNQGTFKNAGAEPAPNMRRVQSGAFGGPDAYSCAGCHSVGGLDGAGSQTQAAYLGGDGDHVPVADIRNPPHVLGLGPVERVAAEMSQELVAARVRALELAKAQNKSIQMRLQSKGTDFGFVTAFPDGRVDTSKVEGVDPDLVVKPFGWKGHQPTIREMAREAFRMHMGLLSAFEEDQVRRGALAKENYGVVHPFDVDMDGVYGELDDGMLTSMVAYLAQLESPSIRPPASPKHLESFARGRRVFQTIKCDGCHTMELTFQQNKLTTGPMSKGYQDSAPSTFDVVHDGDHPKPEQRRGLEHVYVVPLFSDLKRHDMGPALASPRPFAGVEPQMYLTRPLWGLADTAPYMHDGRASTIDGAIRAHGGEAAMSKALSKESAADLRTFLGALTREQRVLIP